MKELMITEKENRELRITSVELVDIINQFRKAESESMGKEYKELQHKDCMKKIRKELEILKTLGLKDKGNFSLISYTDNMNREKPCYSLDRDGMLQMLNSESTLVRFKTIEYINKLEEEVKLLREEVNRKANLLLSIYNGGQEGVIAAKQLSDIEVKEATKPLLDKIEKDKPKVEFTEVVLKSSDNILVRELAKIATDEGIKIGQNNLYKKLREWGYIFKNGTEPYQHVMDKGYFVVKETASKTPYGVKLNKTTLVTPLGQVKIIEKLRKELTNVA